MEEGTMEERVPERRAAGGRMGRRRFVGRGVAVGGGVAAAWLAACGGGGSKSTGQTTASTAAPAAGGSPRAAATSGSQKPTGTVTIVQGVDANTLDPSFRNATPEFNVNIQVFDTLLWRDPKSLKPVPWLAQEFKNVDPLTWEFKLRPNAKFHDGTAVDAEAIKFALDRLAKEKIGDKVTVPRIRRTMSYDATEVVDGTTFRIKTSAPSAVLPDILTQYEIVSPAAYQDESADNLAKVSSKPVGSGPWKFVEWQKDQRIVLEVNPNWWGPPVAFERIIIRPIGETSTRILSLKNGEVDIIVNVPPDNVADVDKSDKARVSSVDGLRKIFVGMRVDKHPALADKRVRQAINYALNFDAISRALLGGRGKRMKTIFNPPHEPPDAKPYPYDVNKAKSLLAEAGYPNGFSIDMNAPTGRYIKDKEIAQAIAQDLDKIGIKANLQVLEWSLYAGQKLTKNGDGPAPLYFIGLGAPVNGQDEAFYIHKDYGLDFTEWQNPDYLRLFDQLKVELDETKFQSIINQMHTIAWDECPWLWVYNQVDFYGASRKLIWDARPDERIAMVEAKWK
jgi:peptide/nickel transport system substrate-binding protein